MHTYNRSEAPRASPFNIRYLVELLARETAYTASDKRGSLCHEVLGRFCTRFGAGQAPLELIPFAQGKHLPEIRGHVEPRD